MVRCKYFIFTVSELITPNAGASYEHYRVTLTVQTWLITYKVTCETNWKTMQIKELWQKLKVYKSKSSPIFNNVNNNE